eukprot:CAMPEP_0180348328 /NCGR_PEP_ID=MMETSP0989-20121125/4875_1 /TAXON_ID=697907 /ORGANISM="non described non described, Strain CCMP2293" /LENGTH=113 /DNA_ID=CAMNT_0022337573 /DNA_START=425 /DNA_END=762 /DNA_ORIENTATION=-
MQAQWLDQLDDPGGIAYEENSSVFQKALEMVQVQETFMADCTMIVASLLLATLAMLVVTTSAAKFACPGLDALWIWHSFAYLGGKHPFLVRLLALISFLMTYDGWLTTSPNKA